MKGVHEVTEHARICSQKDLFVSEATVAELKFGVAKSERPIGNRSKLDSFLKELTILPIGVVLDVFSFEKARLYRVGLPLPDFDLLIGATAIHHNLTLVTNNTKHFARLNGIVLEDWSK